MNLYVSNLSFDTTEQELNLLFSQYGTVNSVKIIIDKFTNKSRGFCFIEMQDENSAGEAIKMLNHKDLHGRALSVSVARPKPDSGFTRRNSL